MPTKRLEGKVALITGAGNGQGQAMAKLFAAEGAQVVAVDIDKKALENWEGVENVHPIYADIMNLSDVENMIAYAEDKLGRLDIVCNVAGINDLLYPLEDTDDARWDRVIDLDLKAPFRIIREAVKGMMKRGSGVFLNIGSYAAYRGNHGPSYSAAKHGLTGLTLSVAAYYADKGIRCNQINPGGVETNIAERSGGKYHEKGWEHLGRATGNVPVAYGQPEDIAHAALWLCCDESKLINGAIVAVDGGLAAF